jgi:hypothetical protein
MRILVACEESQRVCISFREKGHEAFSCDIQDCSGGHPEWHIKDDVLNHLDDGWDMMIAHPPCTFLSNAGAKHLYKNKELNFDRYQDGLKAKEFFEKLLNANISRICIENPTSSKIFNLPEFDQIIEPYYFGDPYKKRTLLWLKGLKPLICSNLVIPIENTRTAAWFNKCGNDRKKNRSKTFWGIARAMADQWSNGEIYIREQMSFFNQVM